jgi:hypothetical protein
VPIKEFHYLSEPVQSVAIRIKGRWRGSLKRSASAVVLAVRQLERQAWLVRPAIGRTIGRRKKQRRAGAQLGTGLLLPAWRGGKGA